MRISQTAAFLPPKTVPNAALTPFFDTSDEWIRTRTGIATRHVVTRETNADLALAVAQRLVTQAGCDPQALDFIIVATMSPDYQTPSVANQVQGALGATNAAAFDVSAACAGFVYALDTAAGLLARGATQGLVIGSEVLSRLVDWHDRRTAVLFGDGAGGVLVTAAGPAPVSRLRSFGEDWARLTAGGAANHSPFATGPTPAPMFAMDGRAVFHFATQTVASEVQALLDGAGLAPQAIDQFVMHQANARILSSLAKRLAVPAERFPSNIATVANTSAASIPILLHELAQTGALPTWHHLVLGGFGGGLNVGTMLLTQP
ncbi:beta-ketoacyl-ACP synthase 3 [Lacticaseibacillus daqingensis]|uniref:beta-ketoacyl-ACP synthase 3 n=1 Tax=Lacticaseibacillus daqingensis TaxID=2486014 RepID=UPI000F77E9C0|nr:beta-ketoacyl-ACP synthase 3 [Lacticaseibacillus daqingensis]